MLYRGMTKNPFINAGAAAVYIGGVVLFISSLPGPDPDTVLMPITMLSLLVLSVLAMTYFFFLVPVQLYFDGHKKEAVSLFTQTTAIFAVFVAALLGALLLFISYSTV